MQEGLRNLLHTTADLRVCHTAGSAEEALQLPALASADVLLVDISLPNMNGIQLIRELRSFRPDLICIVLSTHTSQAYIADALAVGARGYVAKGDAGELPEAIRSVLAGDIYLSRGLGLSLAEAALGRRANPPSKDQK